MLLISIDIFYDYADRQINSIFALTRDSLFYAPILQTSQEKNLRYCETVVELRPEFLEVHLSLNNKTLFCQATVFIDLYPTNEAEYSFE